MFSLQRKTFVCIIPKTLQDDTDINNIDKKTQSLQNSSASEKAAPEHVQDITDMVCNLLLSKTHNEKIPPKYATLNWF